MKRTLLLGLGVLTILVTSWGGAALFARDSRPHAIAFEALRMRLEVDLPSPRGSHQARLALADSALGFPAEVVLEAKSQSGFARLRLMDSAGNAVLALDGRDGRALGVSELALECAGITLADALSAYPPGEYVVEATTVDGVPIEGSVTLSGEFPGIFAVVSPLLGEVVPADGVTIAWTPSLDAVGYVLEIEHDAFGFSFEMALPAWQTSFTLPPQLLRPGETYEYSLAVEGDTDNEFEVEGSFVTARGNQPLRSSPGR
jgi:hypothetical protein